MNGPANMNSGQPPVRVGACRLVGPEAETRAIARNAARLAFPEAVISACSKLEEALGGEAASEIELLVLAEPEPAAVAQAIQATDAIGLRRWPIVVLGESPAAEGVEVVVPADWRESVLTRAFWSAVAQHQLVREKERNQGDLRTLACRISHDLRAPLNGLLCVGEALKETAVEEGSSSVALTKLLFDSVDESRRLIDRVSMLMRASASPVAKTTVAMGEVVWAVFERLERQILERHAVVTRPESWPEVKGVARWLEVVWENLVSNALQHGAAAPHLELGWSRNERELRFWISDDGGGVPTDRVGDLFRPFHLLHHPNARKGLGLSMVQRLVELQGGRCGYETASGGGATFFFILPAAGNARAPTQPQAIQDRDFRRG
jgi:signal transduction histidine kinase